MNTSTDENFSLLAKPTTLEQIIKAAKKLEDYTIYSRLYAHPKLKPFIDLFTEPPLKKTYNFYGIDVYLSTQIPENIIFFADGDGKITKIVEIKE